MNSFENMMPCAARGNHSMRLPELANVIATTERTAASTGEKRHRHVDIQSLFSTAPISEMLQNAALV